MRTPLLAAAVLACVATASAQNVLTTTFTSNNGQNGNMFDIVAINSVCIQGFDVNVDAGTWNIEVYARTMPGSYLGFEGNPAAWTLLGTATGVTGVGLNMVTPLPLPIAVPIQAGTTQAFYVTVTNGTSINYTNGTVEGAVYAQDANIQVLEGTGNAYPFGAQFRPRVFNGNIYYTVGSCGPLPWQTNSPSLGLDFDGVMTNGLVGAVTQACPGFLSTLNVAGSLVGAPWDALVTVGAPTVPAGGGGITLPVSGQVVNVDITQPTFAFVFGATFTNAFVPFSAPVGAPPIPIAAQLVALDGTSPDGVRLSQASLLQPVQGGGSIPGPLTDDRAVGVNLTGLPGCLTAGGFPYFGTVFTQMQVISNGRVVFGPADTDFSPTAAEALLDSPFVGYWTDLNPAAGGTISINLVAPGIFRVDYNAVAYFAQAGTASTFGIVFDATNGSVMIDNIAGIGAGTGQAFLGISAGTLGATDPGSMVYPGPGGFIPAPASLGMIYQLGLQGTLATAVAQILFVPNGNAYDAFSL